MISTKWRIHVLSVNDGGVENCRKPVQEGFWYNVSLVPSRVFQKLKSLLHTNVLYEVTAAPFWLFFYSWWQLRKNTENGEAVTSLKHLYIVTTLARNTTAVTKISKKPASVCLFLVLCSSIIDRPHSIFYKFLIPDWKS